jgi:hypothetical protein
MTRAALIKRIENLRLDMQSMSYSTSGDRETNQDDVIEQIQKELDEAKHKLEVGDYELSGI